MNLDGRFQPARAVADTVLYEGYVLYPYRASSSKNQFRWQWGVLGPPDAHAAGVGEEPTAHTELLVRPAGEGARLHLRIRFLHVRTRQVQAEGVEGWQDVPQAEVDGETLVTFEEATEELIDLADLHLDALLVQPAEHSVSRAASETTDPVGSAGRHRYLRSTMPLAATVRVAATRADDLMKVEVVIENTTAFQGTTRDEACRQSLVGTHVMAAVDGAVFLSVIDPPAEAAVAARTCDQHRLHPVLVGSERAAALALASPVILYDHPEIAPESQGDFYDGLEIDELLSLRVLTLTEEEKEEARATDPRAAAIIDRVDAMAPEDLDRLHGTVRSRGAPERSRADVGADLDVPWWDPGADASFSPDSDTVMVGGVAVGRGTRVRLRPGRRADAHDLFYRDQVATVRAVLHDVDGSVHVAVTVDDDPAADLYDDTGRYLYFSTDEIEPLAKERS